MQKAIWIATDEETFKSRGLTIILICLQNICDLFCNHVMQYTFYVDSSHLIDGVIIKSNSSL